jgi:hypothetical protein
MSYVSLGMSRPEWIKYIVSAIAHKKLNVSEFWDRNKLVFDESWGLLFQALLWKREAIETGENLSGYGIGFMQIQSGGSLAVLEDNVSSDRLCFDLVNDIILKLKTETLEECAQDFAQCFDFKPNLAEVKEHLSHLVTLPVEEKKRGIISVIVWAIESALQQDYVSPEERSSLFSVANQFIRIAEEIGAAKHSQHSKVISILCSEEPGKMSRGLSSLEIAALIHELLRGKRTNAIVTSYAVFDLIHGSAPTNSIEDMDSILRESYRRLPDDEAVMKYLRRLYGRVSSLLSQHVGHSSVMPYSEFHEFCSLEKVKRVAVLWEYNLIAGELEEMLRTFVSNTALALPYKFSFESQWNALFKQSEQYWKGVISRFEELSMSVLNNQAYLASFQSEEEYLLDLPSWFEFVGRELMTNFDLKAKFRALLEAASSIGESIRFDGETVDVLKRPSPTHPLIARDAFYQWFRTFLGIWG